LIFTAFSSGNVPGSKRTSVNQKMTEKGAGVKSGIKANLQAPLRELPADDRWLCVLEEKFLHVDARWGWMCRGSR